MQSTVNSIVVRLDQPEATTHELVGGKGANLGLLVGAGFAVPPGFCVTTHAYTQFLDRSPQLREKIGGILTKIDYKDVDLLESCTAEIRALLEDAEMPPSVATEIKAAYTALDDQAYVAVRSSGTAEDLEGTSFAGLHDTYLDVRGEEDLIKAVQRCWASLWTARATTYRNRNGFDHLETRLAVVVQRMVDSEAAGVMFTCDPRTGRTDEIVINSVWGLGEAMVQGIVTPDEYCVQRGTLRVLEQEIGSKEKEIVRNPDTGVGVIEREVAPDRRARSSLSDQELSDVAALGRRLHEFYEEFPQDIEWAVRDSKVYLLQSRPVTGVELSWDAEVDWHTDADPDPHVIRTRAVADEGWTGAITPLMFSWRGRNWEVTFRDGLIWMNRGDLNKHRIWEYYRGYIYWNCEFEKGWQEETFKRFREINLDKIPDEWHEELMAAPFSLVDYAKQIARIKMWRPNLGVYSWFKNLQDYLDNRGHEADGMSLEELRKLSDAQLTTEIDDQIDRELWACLDFSIPGLYNYFRDGLSILSLMLERWYNGSNENVLTALITGLPEPSAALVESIALHKIADKIRKSGELTSLFAAKRDSEFFDALRETEVGRDLAVDIDAFVARSGHRGHSDRDIIFPRIHDDLAVLYSALELNVQSEMNPADAERENGKRRDAAFADVEASFRRQPLGFLKVEALKIVHDYVLKCIAARDNEREFVDRYTYAIRRYFLELNSRLMERGVFDHDDDFWFLTKQELFDVVFGRANMRLAKAKIAGRKKNWEAYHRKEVTMPKYLQRHKPLQLGASTSGVDEDGNVVLRGSGTSRGTITATARVVKELRLVNTVKPGEIMIANSTDPGWTPVFSIISGVIVETGGLLSHSGLLAREFGFPAACVEDALQHIPDGATIRLDGDAGTVTILSVPGELEEATASNVA